ncbi:MAG: glycoside hydrolase family 32 protein [Hungatella sp.]|nr:glycoside hydrolase family 32 protein [Hungatella sp.]
MIEVCRDLLHLRAPGNWLNDPNGFIYYKGKYHLFYQYFPYAPEWGTMHWGHGVSEDLVHWEHLGIALFPSKRYDENGVFSGSALERDGKLCLYYSAVRYLETDDEDIHRAKDGRMETSQAIVVSEDGFVFDNWKEKRQIIPVIRDMEIGDAADTRDPKVWLEGDRYFMVLGSTCEKKEGRVLFFQSGDGENWTYAGQCRHEGFGTGMECPDLFRVGEQYVFVGSPMGIGETGKGYRDHAVCCLAEFDKDSCSMKISGEFQYMDYGMDLYAPQTNVDRDGRRVMIAWMRMPEPVDDKGEKPWIGMMCIPRVVEVENGHICFRVHPQVDRYFNREIEGKESFDCRRPCRIQAVLDEGEEINVGGYRIWMENGYVQTDRSRVFRGIEGHRLVSSTPESLGCCRLDIFVDGNLIEVFINDGEYVISHVVYGLGDRILGKVQRVFV